MSRYLSSLRPAGDNGPLNVRPPLTALTRFEPINTSDAPTHSTTPPTAPLPHPPTPLGVQMSRRGPGAAQRKLAPPQLADSPYLHAKQAGRVIGCVRVCARVSTGVRQ